MKNGAAYGQRHIHAECAIVWMPSQNTPKKFVDFGKLTVHGRALFRVAHFSQFARSALWHAAAFHYECIIKRKQKRRERAHRAPIHKSSKQPRAACICFNLIVDLHFLHRVSRCRRASFIISCHFYPRHRFMSAALILSVGKKGERAKLIIIIGKKTMRRKKTA